jgi:hypothetical protein
MVQLWIHRWQHRVQYGRKRDFVISDFLSDFKGDQSRLLITMKIPSSFGHLRFNLVHPGYGPRPFLLGRTVNNSTLMGVAIFFKKPHNLSLMVQS